MFSGRVIQKIGNITTEPVYQFKDVPTEDKNLFFEAVHQCLQVYISNVCLTEVMGIPQAKMACSNFREFEASITPKEEIKSITLEIKEEGQDILFVYKSDVGHIFEFMVLLE